MRKALLIAVVVLWSAFALAQVTPTTLPTSFDFETTPQVLPDGWSTNTSTFYTTGLTGLAGKISDQDHYFQIDLVDEPGDVSVWLRTFGGSDHGEFSIEESLDGNSWADIPNGTFNNGDLSAGWVQYTVTADRDSRYIRFFYDDDQSGTNVGIDDVLIELAPPPTTPEINVTNMGMSVPSGGQVPVNVAVGDSVDFDIWVHNIGTVDTLLVSGTTISGAQASEFTILSNVTMVPNEDSAAVTIRFKPTMAGTREGQLDIANNDSNEGLYEVLLYGIGGDFATEPTAQPATVNFTNITSWNIDASISAAASQPDGYIVLRQNDAAVTDLPVDGEQYERGDMIGSAKVAYVGAGTDFDVNDVVADRVVHFAVFAYNGLGQFINYRTSDGLAVSQAASGNMMGNYYASVTGNANVLLNEMYNRISSPHNMQFYSNYATTLINNVYTRDTIDGQQVVTCQYSGEQRIYLPPWDWTSEGFAREHCFARSWMPPDGTMGTDDMPGADLHNLFPTNQDDVNAPRSNHPFGVYSDFVSSYLDATLWEDINGQKAYEVRDEHKGDVARAIMYMLIRYNFDTDVFWEDDWADIPFNLYKQDQATLKQWHAQDPPSPFEIARNDYIESIQDNRNPCIDHPEWCDQIDFEEMTVTGVDDVAAVRDLSAYPNPANTELNISFNADNSERLQLRIVDITGTVVWAEQWNANPGYNRLVLDVTDFASGLYLLETVSDNGTSTRKVVVQ